MGVEPEHEELAALLLPVAGNAVDRAHRQAVVAAEEDRCVAGAGEFVGASAECAHPGGDLVVETGIGGGRAVDRGEVARQDVAMVADRIAEAFQHADEAGGAQAGWAHQRAAARGADLDGRAEQGDAALGSGSVG